MRIWAFAIFFVATVSVRATVSSDPEVWVGIEDDIRIFDFSRSYLSSFDAGAGNIGGIEIVGSTVWVGIEDDVKVYELGTTYLSTFDAGTGYIGDIQTVGNTVWIGIEDKVRVFDFDGNYLTAFDAGGGNIGGIEIIPEPTTLILLSLGGLLLRKRP